MPGFGGAPPSPPSPSSGAVGPWLTVEELVAAHPEYAYAEGAAEQAIAIASEVLYHLSKRRWPGVQVDTIRPFCSCATVGDPCAWVKGIRLPGFPVSSIVEVAVDGVVVDAEEYRVVDHRWLARVDGTSWPCSPLARAVLSDTPSVEVTYTWGRMPTAGGKGAANALAHQMALALSPDLCGSCTLPKRVTTVSRQGVTMTVLDSMTLISEGRTGLAEVDLWIAALNIGDKTAGAAVLSPGTRPRHTRVETG